MCAHLRHSASSQPKKSSNLEFRTLEMASGFSENGHIFSGGANGTKRRAPSPGFSPTKRQRMEDSPPPPPSVPVDHHDQMRYGSQMHELRAAHAATTVKLGLMSDVAKAHELAEMELNACPAESRAETIERQRILLSIRSAWTKAIDEMGNRFMEELRGDAAMFQNPWYLKWLKSNPPLLDWGGSESQLAQTLRHQGNHRQPFNGGGAHHADG
ncbi:uncharacterized protein JN550_006005 [Neoarthrinium moseri]|uniref:uncharacterized protein n=1 Tax=Neoarthrinium moseri TaxID=1658444 RepID=UPI001FDB335E|nr:uncharacterized protein JN550_006005 [Neoarthrinium moseri]KAI1869018.1 hypothetical protein JN550_006005 [Neoarthrinium moseri]